MRFTRRLPRRISLYTQDVLTRTPSPPDELEKQEKRLAYAEGKMKDYVSLLEQVRPRREPLSRIYQSLLARG